MNEAAEELNFEKAASIRDKILSVEKVMETQKIVSVDMLNETLSLLHWANWKALSRCFYQKW